MSDNSTSGTDTTADQPENTDREDRLEDDEDSREEAQFSESVEEEGLLPVPEATPTDGQAPGA